MIFDVFSVPLLQVENGNRNVIWSASEDGTVRQHDLREGTSCPPAGSSHQECRNVLVSVQFICRDFHLSVLSSTDPCLAC